MFRRKRRFEVYFKIDTFAVYDCKEKKEVFECYSQGSALIKREQLEEKYA